MTAPFLPPSFQLDCAHPTARTQRLDVTLISRPACPSCGPHQRIHSRGFHSGGPLCIFDLPREGPVELSVRRRRYECAVCKADPTAKLKTFSERGPDTHKRYDMTKRLYRYILGQVARRPLQEISEHTGVPASTLWDIAVNLSGRLEAGHRFPTPKVLALDGIKILGREYMVMADGVTGLPVGFIDSIKAADVRAWAHTHLDIDCVEVVVADLHKTNTSIARAKFPNAIYVADKWHVIQRFQRVLSQVINKEINDLRAAGQSKRANTIYDFKPGLMAVKKNLRRTRRTSKGGRHTLSFYNDLRPILASSPKIRRAYWARHDFLRFYSSRSLQDAMPWLERFRRHTQAFAAMPAMIEFNKHLASNWDLITNYFETVTLRSDGRWRGYTTNALEQYNGQIRKHLRARNGVRNFDLMRLIAVYGSRRVGEEIQLCSNSVCTGAIGPVFGPPVPPELRERTGTYWTCPECR